MSHTKKLTIEEIILALLGLLALAALVRTMFLGLEIDEEYALSLGFRLVRGDRLFYSMWEPHQLAALPPALLIGLFTAVAGTTTGVLLFVRVTMLIIKAVLSVWFYRSLRAPLGRTNAFLLALVLFVFTPTATAVFGAYFKIQSFVFMPIFGLNNGMVPIISYNYGAARPQRVWKTVRLSTITAMVIMVLGFAIFQLFPSTLLGLFDASETMLAIGDPALRIISFSFLLAGFCIIAGSVFQAIGNPVYSLIVSVCRQMVVLLPVAWLLSRTGRLELVWWSFPIAEVMSFTLSTIFLRRTVKSANEVMNSSAD